MRRRSDTTVLLIALLGCAGCFTEITHPPRWDGSGAGGQGALDGNSGSGGAAILDGSRDAVLIIDGGNGGATGGAGGLLIDVASATGGVSGGSDGPALQLDLAIAQDAPADVPLASADAVPDQQLGSDAIATLPVGAICQASGNCASKYCVDGVCCAGDCTGCNACSNTLTGKADGTCSPVISGRSAHSFCVDETASKLCGNDGTCDGAGACHKTSSGHVCTLASCNGSTFTPDATCDGLGTCKATTPVDCAPFQCAKTGCLKTCASNSDCDATTSYCNTSTGKCASKGVNGTPATQPFECVSNIVADGVCCESACPDCRACSGGTLTGGAAGRCLSVLAGQVAHSACAASGTTCGSDGKCDGTGDCRYPPEGTSCDDTSTLCITGITCQSHLCAGGAQILCNSPPACKQSTTCSAGPCNYSQNASDGTQDSQCPSATPDCYTGSCVGCTSDAHCPSTKPSCDLTTHTCGCRKPSTGNRLTNPGFDDGMSGWTNLGTVSLSTDADGCAASNSIYCDLGGDQRDPRQCISLASGTTYYFGGKFTSGRMLPTLKLKEPSTFGVKYEV
ncbi:MAG TPA: hypothetical protein VF550_05105, partial [Polyangia bacterium]